MAMLTGDIIPLNRLDPMFHAVGAAIIVKQGRKVIASGQATDNDDFAIELPDDVRGEIEVHLSLMNSAPSLVTADGEDLHVTLLYNNVNNFIA